MRQLIIRYHQLDDNLRDKVRSIESKGHSPYIRALMLKRIPFKKFNEELARLSLAGVEEEAYEVYFREVLFPHIQKVGLSKYYKRYLKTGKDNILTFNETFGTNEDDRVKFCKLVNYTNTQTFFSQELKQHYGNDVPIDDEGSPIVEITSNFEVTEILLHEKRHLIDGMLSEGYSAKMISSAFEEKYDMLIRADDISAYAKTFMNFKRKSMEDMIEELQSEKSALELQLEEVKNNPEYTIGERTVIISSIKNKIAQLEKRINHASVAHSTNSFASGVLEYNDIRAMFSDVMEKTYTRFLRLNERSEDNVIPRISQVVNIMAKATDKIIAVDNIMNATSNKTITEEMLEVINPTLDRIEQEEREARSAYMQLYAPDAYDEDEDDNEILGDEEL